MRKCAPEPRALHVIQPALNYQPVAQSGCASIIDLGADHDGIGFLLRHLHDREPELFRKMRARYLNEAQICDIGYDTPAIGIEKHYLYICADTEGHGRFHISNLN